MAPRVALLLCLLLLAPPGASQSDETAASVPEALFFQDGSSWREGLHFTTHPPVPGAEDRKVQFISQGTFAILDLRVDPLPEEWRPGSGDSHATLYLSGLDEVLPLPPADPAEIPDTLGRLRIEVQVSDRHGDILLSHGQTLFAPETLQPRDEVFKLEIPLQNMNGIEVERFLIVQITVSGRNSDLTNISPVHLHAGSATYPSGLRLDAFPYEAYRAWEDAAREEQERNEEILRGQPTPGASSPRGNESTESKPTPGMGIIPHFAVIVALATLAMLERERPGPGSLCQVTRRNV